MKFNKLALPFALLSSASQVDAGLLQRLAERIAELSDGDAPGFKFGDTFSSIEDKIDQIISDIRENRPGLLVPLEPTDENAVVEPVDETAPEEIAPGNTTGDFNFDNSTFFNTSAIFPEGNTTADFENATVDGRRLGQFYNNKMNFIRVDEEAVDVRLNWETTEVLEGGREKYFINPGMIFVENDDGSVEWVRTVRYHSTGGYSNGVTEFKGEQVNEGVWVYYTKVLLGTEEFTGDLSGGFDDESIAQWGIQTGEPLMVADNHMLSNEDTYHLWEDLCEAEPSFLSEKHVLSRKTTTGAEDPKLFELPASMSDRSRWALTFSSYPPSHAIEGMTSAEDCKWSEYSKFQMYFAPGGDQLAHGIDSAAHRLSCGSMVDHEKNWIAFEYENELYYVQNVQPHVVVKVNGEDGECEKVYESSNSYLESLSERVSVRGSATAFRYSEDEYMALLHTHDSYSRDPYTTRAYTFEAYPPFRVLRVSKPLKLQSSGLAFASSLTTYQDKIMVGYGVADRESRMMIMSRDYLESEFESDCDGSVDRIVNSSGETCAEKVVALMLGDDMMPPRRAMNTVGMSHMECRGLLDQQNCEPEMVLKVSRHNKAHNCNEAFSRVAAGTSCSSRIKWMLTNGHNSDEAFRMVADEFKVCRDILNLKCIEEDLHFPETTCKPTLFNTYEKSEPAVLLSLTHADQGRLEPMIQCSGISARSEACEEGDIEVCLEEGKFHLVQSEAIKSSGQTAHATISKLRNVAAKIARRSLEGASSPKVILHTRNPLEIVFEDVLAALSVEDIVSSSGKVSLEEFQSVSKGVQAHEIILRTMFESSLRNIKEWEAMKSFIENPSYDTLMVADEELGDRLLQPAIMAEISRHLGLVPDHNAILDGLQASETMYVQRQAPEAMKSTDFFLEGSAVRLQYICHLMEMVPMFLEATVEQGYAHEIGILTEYCVGFDEEWIVTAGEEIFVGFSETL